MATRGAKDAKRRYTGRPHPGVPASFAGSGVPARTATRARTDWPSQAKRPSVALQDGPLPVLFVRVHPRLNRISLLRSLRSLRSRLSGIGLMRS